jgi:hypothetical protein
MGLVGANPGGYSVRGLRGTVETSEEERPPRLDSTTTLNLIVTGGNAMRSLFPSLALLSILACSTPTAPQSASLSEVGGFPVMQAGTALELNRNSRSWVVGYPADLAAGDLVLLAMGIDGTPSVALPAGFVKLTHATTGDAATLVVAYHWADGTESGNITASLDSGEQGVMYTARVTGADPNTDPAVSAVVTGFSDAPDSPSLTAPWGIENTLWLSIYGQDNGRSFVQTPPEGYFQLPWGPSGGVQGAAIGGAYRGSAVASDDPPAWSINRARDWAAVTLAIRPL